jgi:hypothetical protein
MMLLPKKSGLGRPASGRSRRFSSWLIIAALFFNVLSAAVLPSLFSGAANAAALHGASENTLVLCTPGGIKLIHLDADGQPVPEQQAEGDFCTFCLPLNKPIISAAAIEFVAPDHALPRIQRPIPRDADSSIASLSLKPLGSRAPPVSSL